MNAIILAVQKAKSILENTTDNPVEARTVELEKMKKADLIKMIIASESFSGTKVEDLAKPILADEDCVWLDFATIAALIVEVLPNAKTTKKSIATYASKYPVSKGWTVQPRKTQKQKIAELMSEIGV